MQTLRQNKQTVYYATYTGMSDMTVSGKKTGEKVKNYAYPASFKANVSPAQSKLNVEPYGISTDYSKTMVTDNTAPVLSEEDILWIGTDYAESNTRLTVTVSGTTANGKTFIYDGSVWKSGTTTVDLSTYGISVTGTPKRNDSISVASNAATVKQIAKHNYRIVKVAQSLNGILYGLKGVT